MRTRKTEDFEVAVRKLPADARRLLGKQEERFSRNWLDPRLHVKRLKDLDGVYSFRITRRYRVLFFLRGDEAVFFEIGHRKDIYQ